MSTVEKPTAMDQDTAELEQAIANILSGVRDPAAMDRAAQEMDEAREEIRRRLGTVDLSSELTERDE